jgi:hypothetical protein
MPIKKSRLEQKWYFRVAKVLFLGLPIVAGAIYLFTLGNVVTTLTFWEKNAIYLGSFVGAYYVILAIAWRVVLYLVFGGLEDDTKPKGAAAPPPRPANPAQEVLPLILLLIVIIIIGFSQSGFLNTGTGFSSFFGHTYGTLCKNSKGLTGLYGTNGSCLTCSNGGTAVTDPAGGNCSSGIAGVYCCTSGGGNDGGGGGGGGGDTCIPTGCGSFWRCTGSYYIEGSRLNIDTCLPVRASEIYSSWNGTCRQCPN